MFTQVEPAAAGDVGVGISVGTNGITLCEERFDWGPYTLVSAQTINNWRHVAFVNNNNNISLYLDGAYIATANNTGYNRRFYVSNTFGGGYTGAGFGSYSGSIDEVRVWNRSLSADEI